MQIRGILLYYCPTGSVKKAALHLVFARWLFTGSPKPQTEFRGLVGSGTVWRRHMSQHTLGLYGDYRVYIGGYIGIIGYILRVI